MLIGLGVVAIVAVWLVFSVVRKALGLALLAALIIGGVVLWNDPDLLHATIGFAAELFGAR